jgi:hypothetical protein
MYFFFDESGDFAVPENPSIHRCAVTMGIAVSDRVFDDLRAAFARFVATLEKGELVDGEPKGHRLTYAHKEDFCDILARYDDGISVTPVTLDLSSLSRRNEAAMNEQMHELLGQWADQMLYPEARTQLQLLARQYRNLSVSQGFRIYSLANCIRVALETAIVFLSNRGHENDWESTVFEVDRVQTRVGNREEMVFSFFFMALRLEPASSDAPRQRNSYEGPSLREELGHSGRHRHRKVSARSNTIGRFTRKLGRPDGGHRSGDRFPGGICAR